MTASELADLVRDASRVSVIGLAKNTGKTRTLVALLGEIRERGMTVGLTSVGRDGEATDVIDPQIVKPRIRVPPGGLVASAEPLLRAGSEPVELLARTPTMTPLGRIVIARLPYGGLTEVAGPSTNRETAAVTETMRALGADVVLVDGAINRRAAASPEVADLVVLATGAALHSEAKQVVARTAAAVEVFDLPRATVPETETDVAVLGSGDRVPVSRRLTLGGAPDDVRRLFSSSGGVCRIVLGGALCEGFVEDVRRAARGRPVTLVAPDGSKVFLTNRDTRWYRAQRIKIEVRSVIRVAAITVNPVAPMSHEFDSVELRARLAERLPGRHFCDLGPHTD